MPNIEGSNCNEGQNLRTKLKFSFLPVFKCTHGTEKVQILVITASHLHSEPKTPQKSINGRRKASPVCNDPNPKSYKLGRSSPFSSSKDQEETPWLWCPYLQLHLLQDSCRPRRDSSSCYWGTIQTQFLKVCIFIWISSSFGEFMQSGFWFYGMPLFLLDFIFQVHLRTRFGFVWVHIVLRISFLLFKMNSTTIFWYIVIVCNPVFATVVSLVKHIAFSVVSSYLDFLIVCSFGCCTFVIWTISIHS